MPVSIASIPHHNHSVLSTHTTCIRLPNWASHIWQEETWQPLALASSSPFDQTLIVTFKKNFPAAAADTTPGCHVREPARCLRDIVCFCDFHGCIDSFSIKLLIYRAASCPITRQKKKKKHQAAVKNIMILLRAL